MSLNPIWTHYCANHMEGWLMWTRGVHLQSYLELMERFILSHPFYTPNEADFSEETNDLFNRLIANREFIISLSDKGLSVWANSGFSDFLDALEPYGSRYRDIRHLSDFLRLHENWFRRLYQFFRADIIMYLREQGRNL
jgi:hypothetical protein